MDHIEFARKGGKARWKNINPAKRSAVMKEVARIRWKNHKKKSGNPAAIALALLRKKKLTPERRKEIAATAAARRWKP